MRRIILAELLFLALVCWGIFSIWYDVTCSPGPTISQMTNKLIYWEPAIAFVSGLFCMMLICVISYVWDIKVRYVLAIITLGVCLGHLFWSQDHSSLVKHNKLELDK